MAAWINNPDKLPNSPEALLLQWFLVKHIPYNAVEDPTFKKLWAKLQESSISKIVPPTRQALSGALLLTHETTVKTIVTSTFREFDHISLTTDGVSLNGSSYWTVTASALDENFGMVTHSLGCLPIFTDKHDADTLSRKIQERLLQFDIPPEKIISVTTDQGGAAPCIAMRFPHAVETHCTAHILNTALGHAFDKLSINLRHARFVHMQRPQRLAQLAPPSASTARCQPTPRWCNSNHLEVCCPYSMELTLDVPEICSKGKKCRCGSLPRQPRRSLLPVHH